MRPQFLKLVALTIAVTLHLGLTSGCGSKNSSSQSTRQQLQGDTSERHLESALQNLGRLLEFDVKALSNRAISDLNHWMEGQPENEDWKADELLKVLPASYRDAVVPTYGRLEATSFGYDDFDYLRQAIWSRDVATWVTERAQDSGFRWLIRRAEAAASEDGRAKIENASDKLLAALQSAHPSLSNSDLAKLASAVRLLDWTVRNVQLTELQEFTPVSSTRMTIKQPDGSELPVWSIPARNGLSGPGYMYQPWQTMLFGEGDAWQRARVFMQLARQVDITAVMLAVEESEPVNWDRPWLPAVYLGGELYLMDSTLGLPLPSVNGSGIATLSELVSVPDSVRMWDVANSGLAKSDDTPTEPEHQIRYPVDGEALKRVGVLIDASFAALSKRMVHLERKLVGDRRLTLTVRPSELAAELRRCEGVNDVRIWTVPFDALMYSHAIEESLAENEGNRLLRVRRTRMYGEVNDLTQARQLHFQGRLREDRKARRPGAIDFYRKANRSGEQIWKLVNHNKKALEEMANQPRLDSGLEEEASSFSTTEDSKTKRVPEAKWLSLDRLKNMLEENDIALSEDEVKQVMQRELISKSMQAAYWMGLALYDLNSFPDSANWLRRFQTNYQATDQWTTGTHYNLARAYEAMGNIERAAKLYQEDASPQRAGSVVRLRLLKAKPGQKSVEGK